MAAKVAPGGGEGSGEGAGISSPGAAGAGPGSAGGGAGAGEGEAEGSVGAAGGGSPGGSSPGGSPGGGGSTSPGPAAPGASAGAGAAKGLAKAKGLGGGGWSKLKKKVDVKVNPERVRKLKERIFGSHLMEISPESIKDLKKAVQESRGVIFPDTRLRFWWDIIQIVTILYLSFAVPIRIGFSINVEGFFYLLDVLMDVYFFVDIYLNFLFVVEDESFQLVTSRPKLAKRYLKSWFIIDVLAVIPLDHGIRLSEGRFVCGLVGNCPPQSGGDNSGQYFKLFKMLRLFRLVKLLKLLKVGKVLDRYQDELYFYMQYLNLFGLLVLTGFLGHLMACMFYFVSTADFLTRDEIESRALSLAENGTPEPLTWMTQEFGMIPAMRSLSVRYVGALYWSFTTLTTVGYGDISANTTAERIFAILGMVGGGLMFSVIISYIGTMMKSQTALDDNCKMKMLAVEKFTGEHMVPKKLRKELTRYFRTQYESMGNMTSQVLKDVPYDMREALVEKIYKDMVDRLAILQNCSRLGVVEFCSRLEENHFGPGDIVCEKGDILKGIFIVSSGSCLASQTKTDTSAAGAEAAASSGKVNQEVLAQGSSFGEEVIQGIGTSQFTVQARSDTCLLVIPRQDLDKVLQLAPEMRKSIMNVVKIKKSFLQNKAFEDFPREAVNTILLGLGEDPIEDDGLPPIKRENDPKLEDKVARLETMSQQLQELLAEIRADLSARTIRDAEEPAEKQQKLNRIESRGLRVGIAKFAP